MKLPMNQKGPSGRPMVRDTYIVADHHLGEFHSDVLEDFGTYYQVHQTEFARFSGPKQEIVYPSIDNLNAMDWEQYFKTLPF